MRRCSIVMKIGRIVQCYTPIADSATATLESRSTIHRQAERVIFVYVVIEVRYCSKQRILTTRRARRTCTCDSREHSTLPMQKQTSKKVNKQTHTNKAIAAAIHPTCRVEKKSKVTDTQITICTKLTV
jgi:hypothetical protein